jgi:hypothetical protein
MSALSLYCAERGLYISVFAFFMSFSARLVPEFEEDFIPSVGPASFGFDNFLFWEGNMCGSILNAKLSLYWGASKFIC